MSEDEAHNDEGTREPGTIDRSDLSWPEGTNPLTTLRPPDGFHERRRLLDLLYGVGAEHRTERDQPPPPPTKEDLVRAEGELMREGTMIIRNGELVPFEGAGVTMPDTSALNDPTARVASTAELESWWGIPDDGTQSRHVQTGTERPVSGISTNQRLQVDSPTTEEVAATDGNSQTDDRKERPTSPKDAAISTEADPVEYTAESLADSPNVGGAHDAFVTGLRWIEQRFPANGPWQLDSTSQPLPTLSTEIDCQPGD